MNVLRDTIEEILKDVHIETGRTAEYEGVVNALEIAISRKVRAHEIDHYTESNKDFSGYIVYSE